MSGHGHRGHRCRRLLPQFRQHHHVALVHSSRCPAGAGERVQRLAGGFLPRESHPLEAQRADSGPRTWRGAVAEIRRVATKLGAVSVFPYISRDDVPRLDSPYYEPIWTEAERQGIAVAFHGARGGHFKKRYRDHVPLAYVNGRGHRARGGVFGDAVRRGIRAPSQTEGGFSGGGLLVDRLLGVAPGRDLGEVSQGFAGSGAKREDAAGGVLAAGSASPRWNPRNGRWRMRSRRLGTRASWSHRTFHMRIVSFRTRASSS